MGSIIFKGERQVICYKDMTFCKDIDCKKFNNCPRALTEQVYAEAESWWGSKDAPIAIFMDRLECFEWGEVNE